ncbi:lipoprotein [Halomonas sp. PA5]|nr:MULTISPECIES: lipoprotein [Halomonas]QJQ95453.1 lipoprotein [Halomonas sp. PA5]
MKSAGRSRLAVLALALLMVAGCGQKGPLYPPDDPRAAERYDPQGDVTHTVPASEPDDETPDEES